MPYDWASEASAVFKVLPVNWFLIAAALYLPVVFVAQRLLRHVGPFALNTILMLWNLFLSLSSGYCAYFVWKDLFLPQLQSGTLDGMTCSTQAYLHESARFVLLFNLTKPLEWIDTLFLLLKKRDLGFLHLFHHLTTMLYTLHATLFSFQADGSGIWFCGMNLAVHTFMYGYWAVLPYFGFLRKFGVLITLLQFVQMVFGVAVGLYVTFACPRSWQMNWHGDVFSLLMYAVYFYLFLDLLLQKSKPTNKAKKN